jgi:hypothetical protein
MRRPNIAPRTCEGGQLRHDCIASSVSSFHRGDDLSSFDASFSRAIPGFCGNPVIEKSVPVESAANTWEEDLEHRAKAGAGSTGERKKLYEGNTGKSEVVQREHATCQHRRLGAGEGGAISSLTVSSEILVRGCGIRADIE